MGTGGDVTAGAGTDERVDTGGLDAAVLTVAANVDRWASTSAPSREALLEKVVSDLAAAAPDWVEAACAAKGLDASGYEGSEELLASVGVLGRLAQQLRASLHEIAAHGRPRIPGPLRHVPGGRVVAGVLPRAGFDRMLLAKQRGEVWMQPGVSPEEVVAGQAAAYRDPEAHRGVALVLGAGNVGSLGPNDVLNKLFVDGRGGRAQGQPGQRLPRRALGARAARAHRRGRAAHRHAAAPRRARTWSVTRSSTRSTSRARTRPTTRSSSAPARRARRRKAAGVRAVTKPVTAELGQRLAGHRRAGHVVREATSRTRPLTSRRCS